MKTILALLLATLLLSCTAEETAIQSTDCEVCLKRKQFSTELTNFQECSYYPDYTVTGLPCSFHGQIETAGWYYSNSIPAYVIRDRFIIECY